MNRRRSLALSILTLLVSRLPAQDPPLPAAGERLLQLAFDAASAMPADPHVKTRERLQERVAVEAVRLQQAALAAPLIDRMGGWRQGLALADLALLHAQRGGAEAAEALLKRAIAAADTELRGENSQAWRRDRVRARCAAVYELLGRGDQAVALRTSLVDHEAAAALSMRARLVTAADLDARLAELDELVRGGDFDQVRGALQACAELHGRFYADGERRSELARRVQYAYDELPLLVRLELLGVLADNALSHGDVAEAGPIVADLQTRLAGATWLPSDWIPIAARIAALRGRTGDTAGGRAELERIVREFDAARASIVDIDRADALRPIAEAFAALGLGERALELYRRAVDEGAANPNARPRTEDLIETCLSLVRSDLALDDELLGRLESVRAGLRQPW